MDIISFGRKTFGRNTWYEKIEAVVFKSARVLAKLCVGQNALDQMCVGQNFVGKNSVAQMSIA